MSLFRIEAFEEEGLTIPEAGDALPSNFIPSEMSQALTLRHGAMVVAADLDNDELDEALVVGSYVDRDQAAFALAKYDPVSSRFVMVDAQVFSGQITTDSKVFIDDLDGDGANDIVLTTGYVPEASDLIIVWGTGSDKLPDLNQNLERIRLENSGIKAVAALRSREGKGKMLIASTLDKTYLLELTPEHSWRPVEVSEIPSARAFGIVDFDRDGVEDIAAQLEEGLELFRSIAK